MTDLKGAEDLLWHLGVMGGGGGIGVEGFIVWPRFQLSFFKSMKSLFRPQSFECIKLSQKKPFLD